MNIVMEKEVNGRLQDGVNAILNLNEEEFNELIDMMTYTKNKQIMESLYLFYSSDECKEQNGNAKLGLNQKNEKGFYTSNKLYDIKQIIDEVSTYIQNLEQDSKEYMRCKKIMETRDLEALKKAFSGEKGEKKELVDKLFEVLTDSNIYEKFINFEENSEYFAIDNEKQEIEKYLELVGDIFLYKDILKKEGKAVLSRMQEIESNFSIPTEILQTMSQNSMGIYNEYNEQYPRYMDKRYTFEYLERIDDYRTIRQDNEPNWEISDELKEKIFKEMPQDLSLEEKALYIYAKLCKELEYNEEYLYRDKEISSKFESDFSAEYLEHIVPGSKITCFDFSRIFSKIINELDGNIEAVMITQGTNRGHFACGFYTDKVSVRLEAVNTNLNGINDPTNDLMKAKNGIALRGLDIISDRDGIIDSSLSKVYSLVYGRESLTIKEFVKELKSIPREEINDDIKLKLQSFIEIMQERGITGNEFVQTLDGMCKAKFFGTDIEKAYIGRRFNREGEKHIQRMILFRQKEENEDDKSNLYLIDTASLKMVEPTQEQIIEKINSGDMVYESESHKMKGIDKEI